MKKLLLIMLCMPLFLACDNDDVTIPILNNTRWENMENGVHFSLEFHESESILIVFDVDNAKYTSTQYSYTYEYPNITMNTQIPNGDIIISVLSSDNKTMTLKSLSTSKIIAILAQR
ncbi:hypothetical protein [uncultured Dysgonomonas sp.]|uniref:Lipoprotein n=1 Tax=uncultured Dysgonomonas sp. TaxID=206096 RepID=A0A212IXI7_9BACT|nr:hypothetical protein [uncultured Dysgonomonas sp.]SBV91890.1 exported hypothetical protein [uncultured Dysgonomonas sp.]